MNKLAIILTSLFLILYVSGICAQENVSDTPAGEKLRLLLDALESENPKSFIKENFSDEFLNSFSMDEHISFFRQVRTMHGGFSLYKIEEQDNFHQTVLVSSKKREAWRRIEISVEENSPYKINWINHQTIYRCSDSET